MPTLRYALAPPDGGGVPAAGRSAATSQRSPPLPRQTHPSEPARPPPPNPTADTSSRTSRRSKRKHEGTQATKSAAHPVKTAKRSDPTIPQGCNKTMAGTWSAAIGVGGKRIHIGTFPTAKQASDAYELVKKARDEGGNPENVIEAIKKNSGANSGGKARTAKNKRDPNIPRGCRMTMAGKWVAEIFLDGKHRHLGTFNTADEASAAFESAKRARDEGKNPPGCTMRSPGRWRSTIYVGGRARSLGTFNTVEEASAAYELVKKTLDEGGDVEAIIRATKKEAARGAAKMRWIGRVGSFGRSGTQYQDKGQQRKKDPSIPRGVSKHGNRWRATIYFEAKTRRIGNFDSPQAASVAYEIVLKSLRERFVRGGEDSDAVFDSVKKEAIEAGKDIDLEAAKERSDSASSVPVLSKGDEVDEEQEDVPNHMVDWQDVERKECVTQIVRDLEALDAGGNVEGDTDTEENAFDLLMGALMKDDDQGLRHRSRQEV